jgi:hypothetical protein
LLKSFVKQFTTKHPTDKYIGHVHAQTTYIHIPNKELDEANNREVVTALSTEDGPLKMVKQ